MTGIALEEVCKKIGEFYAKTHGKEGLDRFIRAQVTEVSLGQSEAGPFVMIKCKRPGVLLGPRGQNVARLSEFLGPNLAVKMVEEQNLPDWETAVFDGYYDSFYEEDEGA